MQTFIVTFLLLVLGGCAFQDIQRKSGVTSSRSFAPENLAKSDVDMMAEMNQREALKSLSLLAIKLYRRNPRELAKSGFASAEAASANIIERIPEWEMSPPDQDHWQAHFKLAFLESNDGDRIQAFMTALTSMVMASYEYKAKFFLIDSLSAQKLYNSARNIEIAAWKLSNTKRSGGGKMLVSNTMDGDVANLSFEREFGKLIALQDLLALVIEDKSNRSISRVFQNIATFVFLPI
ncbi:MAG: hypothetical protein B7Y41_08300 [Hydrogenophilales bacterium 28-61-23]|nr:MAG: hypothetical protein B7Y41_08300 [Hydrogenophilales bacterium 28-61-23]